MIRRGILAGLAGLVSVVAVRWVWSLFGGAIPSDAVMLAIFLVGAGVAIALTS